jgi:hypothetical protein
MLDIPEGARVIVPKLDPNGGEDGFVIARAAKARPTLGPTRGCYFFDLKTKTPPDDYRHVVVVDRESVRVIPADYSKRSEQIYADLGSGRRHPVIHSKDEDFNHAVELVFAASSPPPDDFKPQPVSAAEEKQDRERVIGEIERRRGQPKFRQRLLDAYGRRCAISGCNAEAGLEAAHIRTYKGADDNDVRNGLLLRADLHTLFDLGLIKIRTKDWTVLIAPELKGTSYRSLHGKPLRNLPANEEQWPRKVSTIISGRVSTQA